jgi:hypothetical protein
LKQYSSCPQFWPEKRGILKKVHGIEEVKKLSSYHSSSFYKPEKGEIEIGPADLGYGRSGRVILANSNKKKLYEDIRKVRELIQFEVEELPQEDEAEEEEI